MEQRIVFFKDNFWSSGTTEIADGEGKIIGQLDLKSMFNSGIHVMDERGGTLASGRFPFFSNKWSVSDKYGEEVGVLRQR